MDLTPKMLRLFWIFLFPLLMKQTYTALSLGIAVAGKNTTSSYT